MKSTSSSKHCLLLAVENVKKTLKNIAKSEYFGFDFNLNIWGCSYQQKTLNKCDVK